jgi:ATP-binding protein involved in chromosome partitioning
VSAATPDRDEVLRVLRDVHDPELHRSIVDLGMVGDVDVHGGRVLVAIRLTVAGCPLKAEIQRRVTEAVAPLPGVATIQVTMDAMTDEERKRLRQGLITGEERPSPFQAGSRTTVIGVASGKGGVGKSSITANLALALAAGGATVGLLDADVYGYSIPRMMGITRPAVAVDDLMMPVEAHGVRMMSIGFLTEEDSPVIWRGPMLHKALTSFITEVWWDDPDYLLVDLPPGTGDVALSLSGLLPTASFVIVTTPQLAAQRVARRAAAMAARVNLPVAGVIENMSWFEAPDTGVRYEVFSGGGGELLAAELGVPLLGRIPLEPAVAQSGDAGLPVVASSPDSPAARALAAAAERLLAVVPRPALARS